MLDITYYYNIFIVFSTGYSQFRDSLALLLLSLGNAGVGDIKYAHDYKDDTDNHGYKTRLILLKLIHLPTLSPKFLYFASHIISIRSIDYMSIK